MTRLSPWTIRAARPPRSHYRPLVALLAAAIAGMVVDRCSPLPPAVFIVGAIVAWCGWGIAFRRHRLGLASAALLACAAMLGGAWHHACWRLFDADDLATFAAVEPRPVFVEATLVDAPRIVEQPSEFNASETETKTRFTVEAAALRDAGVWRRAVGRVDVQIDARVEGLAAGDRVRIVGRVSRSPPPLNPGEFDFAAHYRAERKLCLLRSARGDALTLVAVGSPWDPFARFSQWRRRGHARLLQYVPTSQAGFASALLLGYRDELQRHENRAFFRTGTIHILSISGLHIGMLAIFLHAALRAGWLRRPTALAVVMLITLAYALVIDAEPPAVRAVLTVLLAAAAAALLRRTLDGNMLAAAALFVLAQNPADLFRAGPQLSFLAAAVLTQRLGRPAPTEDDHVQSWLASRGARLLQRLRRAGRALLDMLFISTLIFVVATPLVARQFHVVSPIALVLTPLLAPPVAIALFAGFLTLTLGAVVPPLAAGLGFVCGTCLDLTQRIVVAAQQVPYGWFRLPGPTWWQLALFYVIVALWFVVPRRSRERTVLGGLALGVCLWSLIPQYALPRGVELRTTFISVGHGLSVLVEEQGGPVWLYDCGRFGAAERGAQTIAGVLWSRGLTHLDAIVVSHTDADHYNALPYLVEEFGVGRILVSTVTIDSDSSAAQSIRRVAESAGVPLEPLPEGAYAAARPGLPERRVLHPPPAGVPGNDNANSIVIELTTQGRRVLLTGDLEEAGLNRLLAMPPRKCDVILAPHHGSARSNPPGLAAWSTPESVVVSGDEDRRGVVRHAFESVGATVYETTTDGAVTVEVDEHGSLSVRSFREERDDRGNAGR